MNYKTIGNRSPVGLQRVFIATMDSIESQLFLRHLEKIVLKQFNCVIYTETDANASTLYENIPLMDVVIFILTSEMLCSKNLFIDKVLPICSERKIPIVPLLMKKDMERQYTRIFYTAQYLCPSDRDETKIPFERKLIDRLSSILLHDELTNKIQNVFHKSLFLSYRRKSRTIANELMKKIHENMELTNVAIWYDERIITGESFRKEIEDAMRRAIGFVLLATDDILEIPNYVHDVEYKKALDMEHLKENIVAIRLDEEPIESRFYECYKAIPRVYSGSGKEVGKRLLEITGSLMVDDSDSLYLMGLAYQNGICVEINPNLAIELLIGSAKKSNIFAMMRLVDTYVEGIGVEKNYLTAIDWQKKLIKSVSDNQRPKEYQKLADIYSMRHDWDESIYYCKKALDMMGDNCVQRDVIISNIIRFAMNKGNDDGLEIALNTCLDALRSFAIKTEDGAKESIRSLSLILFETISILFRLNDSKRFCKKVQAIARVIYSIRWNLSACPEINISECLRDSAFHDAFSQTAARFFVETGIALDERAIMNRESLFEYTDNAMLAEELSYVNLSLEMIHLQDDLPSCYRRVLGVLSKTVSFYMKRGLYDYANRNITLAEAILTEAEQKWYLNVHQDILDWMIVKTELYFCKRDERAEEEMGHLFSLFEAYLAPSEYLMVIEAIDRLVSLAPTDSLTNALLDRQEKVLNQIPNESYFDGEVDEWRLRNAVNRYQFLLMNGDEMARNYYDRAIMLCKKLQDRDDNLTFIAVQRLYLARLRYLVPTSHEGLLAADAVIDALFQNTSLCMENEKDVDDIARRVLYEVDQYLNWLRLHYPAHIKITQRIVTLYLREYFIPYVNAMMDYEPYSFLPPMYRCEFSDYTLMTGVDFNFLKSFRTLFFAVHSFVISNLDHQNEKLDWLDKVIAMYDAVLKKTSQGYLFQVLCNEKNSLIDYKRKCI